MLKFSISGQTMTRTDKFTPATDSKAYLNAVFTFTGSDWSNTAKRAIFKAGTIVKEAVINSSTGVCLVPWEVLASNVDNISRVVSKDRYFTVTVIGENGSKRITTNDLDIRLEDSGYAEGDNSSEPTPSVYAQFVEDVKEHADATAQNAEDVATAEANIKNQYSNALKGSASGEAVRVNDVSPVEHNAKVKVHGKNLFYSNIDKSGSLSGISYDISKNTSTVIFSGVATQENALQLPDSFSLQKGTYTVSVVNLNNTDRVYLRNRTKGEVIINNIKPTAPQTFTLTEDADIRTYIVFKENSTYDNTNVCIQIEKGDVVTEYTPYIDPSTVTVTRCGKNLILYPYADNGTVTRAGVTYTVSEKGIVSASGTSEGSYFNVITSASKRIYFKKGVVYHLSGVPKKTGLYYMYAKDASGTNFFDYGEGATFTPTVSGYGAVTLVVTENSTISGITFQPQIEVGNTSSDYELSKGSESYVPNADGSVDITSISPTMTLLTDTEGVTVECEYNKDINAVIADLYSRLGV